MNPWTARIVHGVAGPTGEPGVLVVLPPSEALDWDLKDEVASTARCWIADREAWWVAAPYASTAVSIATRFNGGHPPLEEHASPSANGRKPTGARGTQGLLQRLRARLRSQIQSLRLRAGRWVRAR
ncbi:MAG TPA: hypothetical protein VFZ18_01405 [Longimicrobiaceae bacterium]